ncbi:Serine/threonine-protein kinase mph1 [Smittium mucronatum]|uniref:Serine/threonine-protein kinase mph1 n=1 Tax=Smittium mucronatum TaxID=133383 RepID=A0A1R0GUP9_9FUNG|nr:Serine/threonine-protein kinase mph1 [Smittium mucronatum]
METRYKRRLRSGQADSMANAGSVGWDFDRPISFDLNAANNQKTNTSPILTGNSIKRFDEYGNQIRKDYSNAFKKSEILSDSVFDDQNPIQQERAKFSQFKSGNEATDPIDKISSEISVLREKRDSSIPYNSYNYDSVSNNPERDNKISDYEAENEIIQRLLNKYSNDNQNTQNKYFSSKLKSLDSPFGQENNLFNSELTRSKSTKNDNRELEDEILREMELELAELDTGNADFTFNKKDEVKTPYTKFDFSITNSLPGKSLSLPESRQLSPEIPENNSILDSKPTQSSQNSFFAEETGLHKDRTFSNLMDTSNNLFSTPVPYNDKKEGPLQNNSIYKSFLDSWSSEKKTDIKMPQLPPKMPLNPNQQAQSDIDADTENDISSSEKSPEGRIIEKMEIEASKLTPLGEAVASGKPKNSEAISEPKFDINAIEKAFENNSAAKVSSTYSPNNQNVFGDDPISSLDKTHRSLYENSARNFVNKSPIEKNNSISNDEIKISDFQYTPDPKKYSNLFHRRNSSQEEINSNISPELNRKLPQSHKKAPSLDSFSLKPPDDFQNNKKTTPPNNHISYSDFRNEMDIDKKAQRLSSEKKLSEKKIIQKDLKPQIPEDIPMKDQKIGSSEKPNSLINQNESNNLRNPIQTAARTINEDVQINASDSRSRSISNGSQPSIFDPKRMIKVNGRIYTKICLSGRGGSSKVYKVLGQKNELYAIKRVSLAKTDPIVVQGYMDECKLLRKLEGNRSIIQLYDSEVQQSNGLFFMVMELGEIDLAGLLRRHGQYPLSMNFIRLYWEQMLQAVGTIHQAKIVHSDLKPANFLLVKGDLKLIDFGIAKAIGNDTTNIHRDQQIGTVNYMSPEALQDTNSGHGKKLMKLGTASDVWSLGVILYQMCYGSTPFSKLSMFQRLVAIPNKQHKIIYPKYRAGMLQLMNSETDPNSPEYVDDATNELIKSTDSIYTQASSPERDDEVEGLDKDRPRDKRLVAPMILVKVVESCLNRDPKQRPKINELLRHPFLTGFDHESNQATGDSVKERERVCKSEMTEEILKKLLSSKSMLSRLNSLQIDGANSDTQNEVEISEIAKSLII